MSKSASGVDRILRSRLVELDARVREHEGLIRALQAGEVDAVLVVEKQGVSISRLQSDEPLYRTIVDALPQSVATVLSDGTIIYANSHLSSLIGDPVESLLGRNLVDIATEADRPRVLEVLKRALTEPQEADVTFGWISGDAPASMSAMRLPVSGVDAIGVVIVDVRDQVARLAAEEASRAKDELIAAVSHELRTPLTSIRGWVELLEMELEGNPELQEGVKHLKTAVAAEVRIVDDLLDLSRSERGELSLAMGEIDLGDLLHAAARFIELQARTKKVALILEVADDLRMHGDADRLRQVFVNLLSNAVKFTDEGSVSLKALKDESSVVVEVADSGMGISEEFLPFLFEPFRRGDSAKGYAGLGIGLAISRRLVEAHGGTIEAKSEGAGQGAMFTVRLPLLQDSRCSGNSSQA